MRNIHSIEAISLDNLSKVTGGCHHHHGCHGCCGGGGGTTIINNNNSAAPSTPVAQASAGFDVQVATGGASAQAMASA